MKKLDKFKPLIHSDCQIVDSNFGSFVEIGECSIISNSNFGDYSYCTRFCDIANTDIKKFSNIASSVRIGPTDHPMEKTSLHHFLYRSNDYWEDKEHDKNFFKNRYSRKTIIGNDTWIGHAAIVKPDIIVGDGAIIGAGSVVTKDVESYTIVAGNPAKIIRRRFSEKIATQLSEIQWWNWSHEEIGSSLDDFRNLNVQDFIAKYK
ncbi:MAG: chloramphenicol acetyltransferase [Candidatus Puniceispirillales bacterium]|tara:strand:- start:239 stop:853 length:615 start_codon:yes stop_codon:yes gene_type:complete